MDFQGDPLILFKRSENISFNASSTEVNWTSIYQKETHLVIT